VLLGSLLQDDRFVRLFHRKREDERSERDEDHAPLTPLPALVLGSEPPDDRTTTVSNGKGDYWVDTHPNAGPAKGAARNMLVAMARWRGVNKSAFVPAPTASAGLPARPAKNLQMTRL
jgi:hypothetical protein